MLEVSLIDSNFNHQEYLTPFLKSNKITWKRDSIRRKINVYTDNFIKSSIIDIPQDGNINICLLLEPYTNPPWTDIYQYIQTDFEKFDLVITHNQQHLGHLIESRPDKFYYSTKCITSSWLSDSHIGIKNKYKNISMPLSSKNFSEGHRLRHVIYEKYKTSGIIDFFGTGVPDYYGDFRDSYTQYKYIIICENTLQKGFNSEKLNDAFLTGAVPIYWGCKLSDNNYNEKSLFYFAPNNVDQINFDFTESLSLLEEQLKYIIKFDPYYTLIDNIEHNQKHALSTLQSENNLYSILLSRGYT